MDELINSIGATAEVMKLLYDHFIRVGFNDFQALELTKIAFKAVFTKTKGD